MGFTRKGNIFAHTVAHHKKHRVKIRTKRQNAKGCFGGVFRQFEKLEKTK